MRASEQDGSHPRPQLVRAAWTDLDGDWSFAFDDADAGLAERWWRDGGAFDRTIRVPFPPEAALSGIGDGAPHRVVWYRRPLPATRAPGRRVVLHFGAVDQEADVWVDGHHVGRHVGGQTAFSFDVTDTLGDGADHAVVVRAFDDPDDPDVPRGKQDWRDEPHAIWYRRTTGIWKSVWLEEVPEQHVAGLDWSTDQVAGSVEARVTLARPPRDGETVRVTVSRRGAIVGEVAVRALDRLVVVPVDLPLLRHAQERDDHLWSPDHPELFDATVALEDSGDVVDSYFGVRSVGVGRSAFLLNEHPLYLRSVLQQGYWEDGQLTATPDRLRAEAELVKALGFNAVRIHQKVEDARFLYWTDRLGIAVWAETAGAYGFSPRAVARLTTEWTEIVAQQRSHPSVVAWVPLNESWGVQDVSASPAQQHYAQALAALTRALDPSRPVISNDGWEHVDSDVLSLHDYETDPDRLRAHFADDAAVAHTDATSTEAGRPLQVGRHRDHLDRGLPVMLTEFGGIAHAAADTWGYAVVGSPEEYARLVGGLFAAAHASPLLAGFCYTQLTDTMQESNGLLRADRTPKLPIEEIRRMVLGPRRA
ncbi:glycoside hydrolase family 2 protein [Amnibacterium kyonggiense]|uniref:Glycosyl hydrolase family 2 n=1 Tax=Amnibacterium kyonggiense TaxID=595671 RepID=A0A4R7FS22_9MICO|nr:glycoside hydrolase family 2 TIM barrel-domain containing protein [Amnibacterium kyonggiense]TDS80637.1 glycosyl hydrolase family 2 [Amnibacterium kyonggiense]